MTLGPIYFNGTKGAMQTVGGVQEPVIMRGADFEYWCCLPDCIETAYQEHRKALGQGEDTSTCITSDMVIAWLEANHTSFIDHDRAGAPLSDDKQSFVYFTEARWYEVAGIDGTWKQGDLAKAFSALKWTISSESSATMTYRGYDIGQGEAWADARDDALANVFTTTYSDGWAIARQETEGHKGDFGEDLNYQASIESVMLDDITASDKSSGDVSYLAELYGKTTAYSSSDDSVFDSHNTSLIEGEWTYLCNEGGSFGTTSLPSPWCDGPTDLRPHSHRGWRILPVSGGGFRFVMKWDFTEC
jgi:hypothetical protein